MSDTTESLGLPDTMRILLDERVQSGGYVDASEYLRELVRRDLRDPAGSATIDDLATKIEPRATFDDLMLPEPQLENVRTIIAHLRHRATVFDEWGFASRPARGLGVTALFAGSSGTGKTMAAEVIANELGLDLSVVDLSMIINKYIGETEKNLRRLFDSAERSGAILLFDEADALFGKRSEVRDSHDRYANIGVSYLLSRAESFRGLVILATNHRDAVDEAFVRRLRFVVEFPFPSRAEREKIWRRAFPSAAALGDVDHDTLAELDVSGGQIHSIALTAAFAAADDGTPIGMDHILAASRSEFARADQEQPNAPETR